jgi:hypothetical protein
MNMENKMTLHEKLNLIQTKLEAPKDMWAYNHKYKYRSAESILSALKPFLREFEVTLTTEMEIIIILHRVYVKCTVVLSDGKETISANGMAREEEVSNQGLNVAQITGSVTSYAKKYALGNLFAIDDVKDPDSNEPTQQVQAAQQSTTATVSQAKPKQVKKQAKLPSNEEEALLLLIQEVNGAQSSETLIDLWKNNEQYQKNYKFFEPVFDKIKDIKTFNAIYNADYLTNSKYKAKVEFTCKRIREEKNKK